MNSEEIFQIVEKIENSLDLSKFQINNIDIWPLIRIQLVSSLNVDNKDIKVKHKYFKHIYKYFTNIPKGILDFIKIQLFDHNKNDSINSKRDILFLTTSSSKRIKLKGGWYDVFMDPIIDICNKKNLSTITYEISQNLIFKYPRYRKTILLQPLFIWYYLCSLFHFFTQKTDNLFDESYHDFIKLLTKNGLYDYKVIMKRTIVDLYMISYLSKYFLHKLKKIKPKIVILEPYYGSVGIALCIICKRMGIKTFDIQHGVQGKYHPAYSSYNNVPSNGYNVMPDYFLVWSKDEYKNILNWSYKVNTHKPLIWGNLIQNMFLRHSKLSEEFDKKFKNIYNSNKKIILITLQWDSYLPEIYLQLLSESPYNYFYLVRFHPTTNFKERDFVIKKFKSIKRHNYEIKNATELPLYGLLRNVDLHITENSSVVIEASYFNVKSIIVNESGYYYYKKYIDDNSAYFATNVSEILHLIKKIKKKVYHHSNCYDSKINKIELEDIIKL